MLKRIDFYKALEILHNGGTIIHANSSGFLTEFVKKGDCIADVSNLNHTAGFSLLKPEDSYMTDVKKRIDFISIEYAYEGDERTKIVDFKDEDLIKIKKEHGIDLPALIEKIVK